MSMASEIIQSVKFIKEHHAWKAVPSFLIHPFFENISGFILAGEFKNFIPPEPLKLPLEIREATPEDAPKFRSIIPPMRIRRFVSKMEAGERCVVGLSNDEVIYFAWAAFAGQSTAIESPIMLGKKDVYYWGAYCMPEYRRFGVSLNVHSYHEDLMRQLGYETSYRLVKFMNKASQSLCQKLRLRVIGRVYGVRILKWRIYRKILNDDE
jgi:hypothetical protein